MSVQKNNKYIEQLVNRTLSSWERKVLRHALADSYKYDYDENYVTLKNVMHATIGESVSTDLMRRFIQDTNNYIKKGKDKKLNHQKNKFRILLKYLFDNGRLTKESFVEENLDHLAPSALTKFFNPDWDGSDHICQNYKGLYKEVTTETKEDELVTYLNIELSSDRGYFKVTEIIRKDNFPYDENGAWSHEVFSGWGIPASENNFFLFLKHLKEKRSVSYINIGEMIKEQAVIINKMLLVRNKHLLDQSWAKESSNKENDLFSSGSHNVLQMERVDDFSCTKEKVRVMTNNGSNVHSFDKKKLSGRFLKTRSAAARKMDVQGDKVQDSSREGNIVMDEEKGKALYDAAFDMRTKEVERLLRDGAPINYQSPYSGMTSLHAAAYHGDVPTINVLLSDEWPEKCNLLIRDNDNLLPSGCAAQGTGGGNIMALAERLMDIEKAQGAKKGIAPRINGDEPLTGKPKPPGF